MPSLFIRAADKLDDLAVQATFRVVARGDWFCLAEAGSHSGRLLPERFEPVREGRGAPTAGVVLGAADDRLRDEARTQEQEGQQRQR